MYFAPLGKGEQRLGLMPLGLFLFFFLFFYLTTSLRAFSENNRYQRKNKAGAPLFGLSTSLYYYFMISS